ncbi:MAG: hypothetical protein ACXW3Y_10620, partial [Rhodoplanes sp.]
MRRYAQDLRTGMRDAADDSHRTRRCEPARLGDAVVVVIDAQREYVDGALPLPRAEAALDEIGRLLARA